jgi:hypothetical protein
MQLALARIALANQYAQYLASPDPLGVNRSTYVYRTAVTHRAAPQAPPRDGGGSDTLAIVLGSVLGAAAVAGLAVLWARS